MLSSVKGAFSYFGLVFAVGFALGMIRTVFVGPVVGPTVAVMLEIPFMLAMSWFICRWVIRFHAVPAIPRDRAVMGGIAFCLLMMAELAVSFLMMERALTEHLAHYRSPDALIGLAAKVAFALFPLLIPEVEPRHMDDEATQC